MGGNPKVKVGCCGFPVAQAHYQELFSLVEIQQTFYQPPRGDTARNWRATAPQGFEFTLKAWQLITHESSSPTYRRLRRLPTDRPGRYGSFRPTNEVLDAWETTARIAATLDSRVILFQCPASFDPTPEHRDNMARFFSRIDRRGLVLAWEPRGSWQLHEIAALCRDLALVHCVDPFKSDPAGNALTYFRLHGKGGYHYRYSDEDLRSLAEKVQRTRGTAYVLFNNTAMFDDAGRFSRLMDGSGQAAPPPP